jgi:hypothetical protein
MRSWLTALVAGAAGAGIVILIAVLWGFGSGGGFVRTLGGGAPNQPSANLSGSAAGSALAKWEPFAGKSGYSASCDYRIHLLMTPEKAAKMSIDLSRYAEAASFIYPTIVNQHFLQAVIMEPGEPISVDIRDTDGGDCDAGRASLSNLPGMCFDTKIEQRC